MSRETPFPVGVVDNLEDKKDEHNTLGSESESESELIGQKGNHSPHNSEVSGTRAESEQQGVVLQEGYSMICKVCAVENCRSGYNQPIFMVCHLCCNHGKHWRKNCPTGKYRGPPMPELYGCFYWNKKF
ncbi:hypothetical protein M0R45_003484 [Rubus argutus]|uniref:Uncharacterized protein n=1 Tax=Rubus argutus TaxID=59490 RepID=A0AAW1YHF6_RUBAR